MKAFLKSLELFLYEYKIFIWYGPSLDSHMALHIQTVSERWNLVQLQCSQSCAHIDNEGQIKKISFEFPKSTHLKGSENLVHYHGQIAHITKKLQISPLGYHVKKPSDFWNFSILNFLQILKFLSNFEIFEHPLSTYLP